MAKKKLIRTETVGAGQDAEGEFETLRDVFDDGSKVLRMVRDGVVIRATGVAIGGTVSVVNMEVK